MQVELIACTSDSRDQRGPEEIITHIARVSNPANQDNTETAPKLIRYLIKQGHWSPFEHVSLTFKIVTSRAIAAQILRHRSFTFQEFSQRYAEAVEVEIYEARRQDVNNRQNSIDDMHYRDKEVFKQMQSDVFKFAFANYKQALLMGIAKEQARMLLPLGTQTTIYMTGSVRSWIHYFDLRCDVATQLEHRKIACAIRSECAKILPNVAEALSWQMSTINQKSSD